ncbi:hypothetical protein PWT90_02997 [Aphanocladium album]|nr:hypothetical protein PWT90_02997 [Aphanocladium album]
MEAVTSSKDLIHLISGSPHCNRVFAAKPERYMLAALRSVVPARIWTEFCAAVYSASVLRTVLDVNLLSNDKEHIVLFLGRYFSPSPNFAPPSTRKELLAAYKLHRDVDFFIKDITFKASKQAHFLFHTNLSRDLANLSAERVVASVPFEISDTEKLRIYRACLRFEIYSKVFRPAQRPGQLTRYRGREQFQLFLERFEPWGVEEVTCVHQHLSNMVRATLTAMNREFESEVLRLVAHSNVVRARGGDVNNESWSDSATVAVSDDISVINDGWPQYFSTEFSRHSIRAISSIVSSGLSYMHGFARSDNKERFELLRRNYPVQIPFLASALPVVSLSGALPTTRKDMQNEDPTQANLGYVTYKASEHGGYLGIQESDDSFPYRALGYVFWDSERIASELFREAFSEIRRAPWRVLSKRYTGRGEQSPEKNLSGVELSESQLDILNDRFGLLYEM